MRRFSEVIDDLGLKDIPLYRGLLCGGVEVIIAQCSDFIIFCFQRNRRVVLVVLFN